MDVSDGAGDLSCDRRRFYDLVRAAPKKRRTGCHNIAAAHRSRLSDADRRRKGRAVPHRERTPYELLDEPLNLLSEYDREQLEQGITASSEGELRRLLEDFFS